MTRSANLRNLLENLLQCSLSSSPVTRSTFPSETSLFLFAKAYFISNSNIFYKTDIVSSRWHPWWEHGVLTCQWQVNYWRADRRHQPSSTPPKITNWFTSLANFFCLLPPMQSLVPGYLALILCLTTQVQASVLFGHSINSSFNTPLAHVSQCTLFAPQNFA